MLTKSCRLPEVESQPAWRWSSSTRTSRAREALDPVAGIGAAIANASPAAPTTRRAPTDVPPMTSRRRRVGRGRTRGRTRRGGVEPARSWALVGARATGERICSVAPCLVPLSSHTSGRSEWRARASERWCGLPHHGTEGVKMYYSVVRCTTLFSAFVRGPRSAEGSRRGRSKARAPESTSWARLHANLGHIF